LIRRLRWISCSRGSFGASLLPNPSVPALAPPTNSHRLEKISFTSSHPANREPAASGMAGKVAGDGSVAKKRAASKSRKVAPEATGRQGFTSPVGNRGIPPASSMPFPATSPWTEDPRPFSPSPPVRRMPFAPPSTSGQYPGGPASMAGQSPWNPPRQMPAADDNPSVWYAPNFNLVLIRWAGSWNRMIEQYDFNYLVLKMVHHVMLWKNIQTSTRCMNFYLHAVYLGLFQLYDKGCSIFSVICCFLLSRLW
jgi:hypothetical protein